MGVRALAKYRAILLGVCVSMGLAGAAAAEPQAPAANTPPPGETTATSATDTQKPPEQEPEKKPEDEVICKKMDAPTGSRTGAKKVCRTKAEWAAQARAARETTEAIQDRGRADNPPAVE